MSELFDLLNFGTPRTHAGASRSRSLSPSPRGRIAWDACPSSSPHDASPARTTKAPAATPSLRRPLPSPEPAGQENILPVQLPDPPKSPSVVRHPCVRRRARAPRPTTYTYHMCTVSTKLPHSPPHGHSPKRRKTRVLDRAQSDPAVNPVCDPSSDDSFSRVLDDDPIDASALEQVAAEQGW